MLKPHTYNKSIRSIKCFMYYTITLPFMLVLGAQICSVFHQTVHYRINEIPRIHGIPFFGIILAKKISEGRSYKHFFGWKQVEEKFYSLKSLNSHKKSSGHNSLSYMVRSQFYKFL